MTPPTDRDVALERLLQALPPVDSGPTGDCLDAEAAAALSDGGLSPAERTAYMAHVSTCGHCQALLAALIRITPAPAPARAWWQLRPWPWLVPALATGLALTIWIAVERAGPRVTVVPLPVPIAEPAKEAAASADATKASPSLDRLARSAPEQQANGGPRSRQAGQPVDALAAVSQRRADMSPSTNAPLALPTMPPAAADTAPGLPPAPAVAGNAAPAQQAFAPGRRDSAVAFGGVAAPAPASPPPPAAVSESVGLTAPGGVAGGLAKASAAAVAIDVVSSDPRLRWRIVGSAVEHSRDGGATWTPQAIGVSARLTAGSAPLPEVCWIVGDGGTVVVTADGISWNRVAFPEPAQLASVNATSADAATVTTADGRVFTTTDRGRTWK